jgi:hypothetical protein
MMDFFILTATMPSWPIKIWSGRWESNPRHKRWQRFTLPLSYTRIILYGANWNWFRTHHPKVSSFARCKNQKRSTPMNEQPSLINAMVSQVFGTQLRTRTGMLSRRLLRPLCLPFHQLGIKSANELIQLRWDHIFSADASS